MTRHAWVVVVAGCLAGAAGCQSTPQHLTIKRNVRQDEWRNLARELDRAPIYAFSAVWQPAFDAAVDMGVPPARARTLLRTCARVGVSLEVVNKTIDGSKTADQVMNGLDLALAEAQDERRRHEREHLEGYRHVDATNTDAVDLVWDRTAYRIERFPIFVSAILWQDHFEDMIRIGVTARQAGANVVRATQVGASTEAFGKLLARHAADPAAFQQAFGAFCDALSARWDALTSEGGYDFMRGEKAKVKEAPKVADIKGKGSESTFDAAVAIDPAVLGVAGIEARMLARKPGPAFSGLASGVSELLGSAWAQVGVVGASEADLRKAAGRAPNLGQLVRGFDGGVAGQAVAAEGGAVRVVAIRMSSSQDAEALLTAVEAACRAQDDASAERNGPIESADYEAAGLNVAAGFLVTKGVAHGAGEVADVGFLAVRSGAFVIQATVIYGSATVGVARDAEQLRSFVEQVLAILPQ